MQSIARLLKKSSHDLIGKTVKIIGGQTTPTSLHSCSFMTTKLICTTSRQ